MKGRFVHLLHGNEGMVKFFSHLLHEKLKVWLKNIPKKLSEHARLLWRSE